MKLGMSPTSRSMSTISCMFAVAARYSLSDSSDFTRTGCERSFVSVANGFSDHPAIAETSSHDDEDARRDEDGEAERAAARGGHGASAG